MFPKDEQNIKVLVSARTYSLISVSITMKTRYIVQRSDLNNIMIYINHDEEGIRDLNVYCVADGALLLGS